MGRQALFAAAAAALLAIAAYVVHQAVFSGSGAAPPASGVTTAPLAQPETSAPTTVEPSDGERAVVRTLTGHVRRRSSQGAWQPLKVGDELHAEDLIRTAEDATVGIDMGEDVRVEISEGTEVRIVEITRSLSHVRLSDGRILSAARGGERSAVRVDTQGSDAVAEATDAEFAVMSRQPGQVAVAATKGQVKLSAQGKAITIAEGQQSLVTAGQAPSEPMEIPPTLFLELGPPPPATTAAESVTVAGRTTPGAVLNISGGRHVVTDAQGEFAEVVALHEGDNDIVVEVQDVMGRHASKKLPRIKVGVRVRTAPTTEVAW